MGMKARIRAKFPANVVAKSPLALVKSGRNYTLSLDAVSLLGGTVTVFQLRVALGSAGLFDDVDNAIAVDPGSTVYEAWISGGKYTKSGDALYSAIESIIGSAAASAAYTSAESVTL